MAILMQITCDNPDCDDHSNVMCNRHLIESELSDHGFITVITYEKSSNFRLKDRHYCFDCHELMIGIKNIL